MAAFNMLDGVREKPRKRKDRHKTNNSSKSIVGDGDAGDFEPSWEKLRDALRDIHQQNRSQLSFEVLCRASYKIVLKRIASFGLL